MPETTSIIFRIELQNGEGMYRNSSLRLADVLRYNPVLHPNPRDDSKLLEDNKELFQYREMWKTYDFIAEDYVFGFSSIDQLRRWLYKDDVLLALHNAGLVLSVYEGDVRKGHTQAVIHKHTAILKEQHSIKEYFKLA